MAVHPNSMKALQENREKTQFRGEYAVNCQKKSVEARLRDKTLGELADIFGRAKVDSKTEEKLRLQGITEPENMIQDMAMIYGLYAAARRGSAPAAEVLAKLKGALNQNQTNINVNNTPIIIGGENDLQD